MVWRPAKAMGLIVGVIVLLTILGLQVFLVQSMVSQRPGSMLFLTALLLLGSLPLLVLWSYWYYELISLRYYLDRKRQLIGR